MTTLLAPLPVQRFFDNNNNPLAGGFLYTYQAGTTIPSATFTDSTGSTPNTNPIALNARGEASVWLTPGQSYKFILQDASGNTIWTSDNLTSPIPVAVGNMTDEKGSGGQFGFVGGVDFIGGTTTTLTLSQNYGIASNLWVAFDGVEQGADTFSLNGTTLTFNAPIPVGTNKVYVKGGTTLSIGTIGIGTVFDVNVASNAAVNSSKISYTASAANAVTRTVTSKLNEFISLKDLGCKLDGVTDDSTAFNNAILAAIAGGFALYAPPGMAYIGTTTIVFPRTMPKGFMFKSDVNFEIKYSGAGTAVSIDACYLADISFGSITGTIPGTTGLLIKPTGNGANGQNACIVSRISFQQIGGFYNCILCDASLGGIAQCQFNGLNLQNGYGIAAATMGGQACGILITGSNAAGWIFQGNEFDINYIHGDGPGGAFASGLNYFSIFVGNPSYGPTPVNVNVFNFGALDGMGWPTSYGINESTARNLYIGPIVDFQTCIDIQNGSFGSTFVTPVLSTNVGGNTVIDNTGHAIGAYTIVGTAGYNVATVGSQTAKTEPDNWIQNFGTVSGISVPATSQTSSNITFNTIFNQPSGSPKPYKYGATVINPSGTGNLQVNISAVTNTGYTVTVVNPSGSPATCGVQWFAEGY